MQTACRQPLFPVGLLPSSTCLEAQMIRKKESDQQRAAGFLFLGHPSMPSSRKQWQPSIRANTTKRRGMDTMVESRPSRRRPGRASSRRCHATRRQKLELETK
ncbi:hypothetical protein GE21DRAFT_10672 [Neurospora crassa]|uniref:Uncharacterized protein n=1 Tax=Neurospora crassa (strain ATCC 24698 / 74-OR23-1A / CBS 708.71 / DSM 1257 / FGSC 987) TaxID=367110 RepID=V5IKQ7_NEUCR|nr:hypothetical protein NCU17275 [Neurospora crassa OR74A]XP_011395395.1 uncharacterized protein NCU17275 [Neurospora crassa OR74A]ESA42061.1 hypothetical protein NCU17275 [Neurospora crassa OR74A]ESA42062.1 hypothetical protein, variant [Neurospora crassa OR74A]KHE86615.1 hypothetical protein GE21DRAFT_10672 [Neurospora crassa]|eukprot:XP_011395394.1 hypothetical protein NCU17275 [Neurospora crassa OR74A]